MRASLLLAAISTVLLVAPVAYHRLVFRQHQKDRLIKDANVMALGGLAAVALAISGAVLLWSAMWTRDGRWWSSASSSSACPAACGSRCRLSGGARGPPR